MTPQEFQFQKSLDCQPTIQIEAEPSTRHRSTYPRNGCLREAALAREAKRPRFGLRWFTSNCFLIREHAVSGCAHCGLLLQVFVELLPEISAANNRELETSHVDALERGHLQVRVRCSYFQRFQTSAEDKFTRIDIFTKSDIVSDFTGVTAGLLVNCALSDEWTRTTKKWLSECHSQHTECAPIEEYKLPSRLVKITKDQTGFLLNLNEEPMPGERYVALSHCWGNMKPVGTTKQTMEQHKKSIPFGSLSKTFQDAVQACHALGFQYIWIDSLCIAQADPEDWEREAAAMGSTFGNAALVIAATAAADGSQGLFREVPPQRKITLSSQNGQTVGQVYARIALEHPDLSRGNCGMPLSKRAWCFQERVLAARILHFGEQEMVWECGRKSSCECSESWDRTNLAKQLDDWPDFGVKGFHKVMLEKCRADDDDSVSKLQPEQNKLGFVEPGPFGTVLPAVNDSFDFDSYTTREQLVEYWHDIVTQYVSRDISFCEDRLPAMASAADQFASLGKLGEYIAGLWTGDLLRCLAWFRDRSTFRSERQNERTPVTGVPSWSWASVAGPWEYVCGRIVPIEDSYPMPTIQKICHNNSGEESAITKYGIAINISGLLKAITLVQYWVCEYFKHKQIWVADFEIGEHITGHGLMEQESPMHLDSDDVYWDFILNKGSRALRSDDAVHLLYVYTQQHRRGSMRCYLVLRQTANQRISGEYERVGYFKSISDQWMRDATWSTLNLV